mgnify:CR=1|tara:strand:- start:2243 stop:2680 length:438 start_codon:yes stop_codon:yes gene_type:complete
MLNLFKKTEEKNNNTEIEIDLIKITSLLIHAAKIDGNYSEKEKLIIRNFLKSINSKINFEDVIKKAEKDENNSNQILKYTQEVKKNNSEFKSKIIKILWKIVLSDNNSDMYENTLMRRIAGLLYVPDKLVGDLKLEILKENNKKL